METVYRIYDVEGKDLYIQIQNHYFKLSEGKQAYRDSKITPDKKDDSILIELGEGDLRLNLTFGVEEGEKFALALLNLCHSIKY